MTLAALWLDASVLPDHFEFWSPIGRPEVSGRLVVAGPQAGPTAVRWVAQQKVTDLIVLCRPGDRARARYFANVLSGAVPRLALSVQCVAAGPLVALLRAADVVRGGLPPSAAVAAIGSGAASSIGGVWLTSVAKLRSPNPSFGQHIRSLIPVGPGFLVLHSPESVVLRNPQSGLPALPEPAVLLVASPEGSPVPATLQRAFPNLPTYHVPVVTDPRVAYGATGVEFTVDGPGWAMPAPSGAACPVCAEPLFEASCPFCHVIPARSAQ